MSDELEVENRPPSKAEAVLDKKTSSPQAVEDVDTLEMQEGRRLEEAQREAEKEWQELECQSDATQGRDDGESRVPALLQMAVHQVQHDPSLTEEERKERADYLLARAKDDHQDDQAQGADTGQGASKGIIKKSASPERGTESAPREGGRGEGGSSRGEGELFCQGGAGARQQQLASLLCKAEQYSMFIRQSQMEIEASRPIAPLTEEKQEVNNTENEAGSSSGRRKSRGRGSNKRAALGTPGKRTRSVGKKAKSESGEAFSSAASKMEKAKADAKDNKDDSSFRQPDNLVGGTLKPYQLEGLRWLVTLYENGLSGILADEMGLGKTIQVIALIAHLRSKNVNGPFLVTAPLATLPNWINEFKKWLPSVNVLLYHGSKEHRSTLRKTKMKPKLARSPGFPIVITSYEVSIIDRAALQAYSWQYLIIDEGQRIKNASCLLVRELKKLDSENRLLLSGTPIQNTLEELWSLLNFVNPQIFDDLSIFQSWFGFKNIGKETSVESIVDEQQHSKIVSKLHEILRPFLIRRMKKDVLASDGLPPKREVVVYAGMTSLQRSIYDLVEKNALRQALIDMGFEGGDRVSEMNPTMNQRKVCQHPFLFGEPKDKVTGEFVGVKNPEGPIMHVERNMLFIHVANRPRSGGIFPVRARSALLAGRMNGGHLLVSASGKLALMDRLLKKLNKAGHKVLIFSQMTRLLDILEDYLRHRGWLFHRIDGSTEVQDRQKRIDEFNSRGELFVFLLSTRAGGLGINLCAADTCILFDSDWNPHQDSQAMARCHRIGQTSPVLVYRLLTTGSVEIDMMEKQISKKKLERVAVQGGDFGKAGRRTQGEMTVSHLRTLLEDDVEDLAKRALCPGADGGVDKAITEEELEGILDRERVFASSASGWGSNSSGGGGRWGKGGAGWAKRGERAGPVTVLPREGAMYDVVDELDVNVLSSME